MKTWKFLMTPESVRQGKVKVGDCVRITVIAGEAHEEIQGRCISTSEKWVGIETGDGVGIGINVDGGFLTGGGGFSPRYWCRVIGHDPDYANRAKGEEDLDRGTNCKRRDP